MNMLVAVERTYSVDSERKSFHALHSRLNAQQQHIFAFIMSTVDSQSGGVFFVFGSGGTGKTYLWSTLIACIRSRGKLVLPVALSDIASMLLPDDRTTHSRFRIPIDFDNELCCPIDVGSDLAELINASDLIIWDEASLQNRHAFEVVDQSFRDVCRGHIPNTENRVFGGKVVVLGGDFYQILPVIPNSTRASIVT
jgi:ATP-dependent DNA helicase PIF1